MRRYALEVDERELATILGALRFYQAGKQYDPESRMEAIEDIVTDGGEFESLDSGEIDELCERINTGKEE